MKTRLHNHTQILLTAAMLASAPIANAALITFSDRATFLGAVPGAVNYDFETSSGFQAAVAPLTSFAAGQVTTTTPGGAAAVDIQTFGFSFGQAIGGLSAAGGIDNFAPVLLTFTTPQSAVGFDDLDLTPDELAIIRVSFSDATPTQTFTVTDTDGDFSTAGFFGVVSMNPIASIEVFSAESPTEGPNSRANLIDNVVLANPVPEPEAWLTASFGLAALAFAFVRRSARSAGHAPSTAAP
jgi:hypothetical protein